MTAVLVGKSKLKIRLEAFETAKLFKATDGMSSKNFQTRYILKVILSKAISKTGFRLDCERLKVELFPSASGGCIIYFTKSPYFKRYKQNPNQCFKFIMEFSDSGSAVAASRAFVKRMLDTDESCLYKFKEKYYIVVSSKAGMLPPFPLIKEFADSLGCSDMTAAIVSEYGDLMIKDSAIEKLATL